MAKSPACPAVWTQVSSHLTGMFLSNGQCNDDARAAIRAAFHDCGTWDNTQGEHGGCDGSLVLAQEYLLPQSQPLEDISNKLLAVAQQFKVSVADTLAFAGAHAIVTCPGGPTVQTFVGRKDNSTAGPVTLLPGAFDSGDSLFTLFENKGFDKVDLAALVGAHTSSKQFLVNTADAGQSQDSTPGTWDVKFYSDTTNPPPGTFVFQSDINLANHPVVGPEFKGFVNGQGKWNGKFADAMKRMLLLGVPGGSANLIDCTNALPKATPLNKVKRQLNPFSPRN
ncbi:heme peroxidase [Rhizodiscina lignyota]|uniref:Peroxidase n=1 Tax=Rhizodiscina lignyota TaxID=1504668 RepID=A0A9P4IIH9_9PEZI|nr:heme peroxidase [Rhizodiscina lignyota]